MNQISYLSDHCSIGLSLKVNFNNYNNNETEYLNPLPTKYIWDEESKQNYNDILKIQPNETKFHNFLNKNINSMSINQATDHLTNILISAADSIFKRIARQNSGVTNN